MRRQSTTKPLEPETYEALASWYKDLQKRVKKGQTDIIVTNETVKDYRGYPYEQPKSERAKPTPIQEAARKELWDHMMDLHGKGLKGTDEIEFYVQVWDDGKGGYHWVHIFAFPKGTKVETNEEGRISPWNNDNYAALVSFNGWDRIYGSIVEIKRSNGWIRHNHKKTKGKDKDGEEIPAMDYEVVFYKTIKCRAWVKAHDSASVRRAVKANDFEVEPIVEGEWLTDQSKWEMKSKQEEAWKYMTEGDI